MKLPSYWTWSKSKIKGYRACPFAFKLQNFDKPPIEKVESLDKGVQLHSVFDKYYLTEDINQAIDAAKFPKEYLEKYSEHIQNFLNWNKRYPNKPYIREEKQTVGNIVGVVDRIDELNEKTYIVIDYKTSMGKDDIKDYLDELLLYGFLAQEKFKIKVTKVAIYFSGNDKFIVEDVTQEQIKKNHDDMQEEIKLYEEAISIDMFEPNTGPHCNWCAYRKYCKLKGGSYKGD
jgi:CRISPR/Cas system-associated exonuclease Cas4 (RecB family)